MNAWHRDAAELRRSQPIVEIDVEGVERFWALTRHADVLAVSRDNERWLNTPRSVLMPDFQWDELLRTGLPLPSTLVHLDGDDHRIHRQITNDWFKPAAVGRRQEKIDQFAQLFIDRMRDMGGTCDFAADIAQPYTLRVIMDIYGVPEEDEPLMLALTQGIFGAADPEFSGGADPQAVMLETAMRYIQYFNGLTEERRQHPGDDLATVIANGDMDDLHRLWYFIIVATAGHDTTSYALSGGMQALLSDPAQLTALAGDTDAIVTAADEMIRWTSPVRHFMRYPTEATDVGGVTIPAGGRVLLSYPSANRDEDVFTNPMTFDVRRPDADKLISFGVGAHFCLGAQFARREVRTMMGKLAEVIDDVEPAGPAEWSLSHFVSGVKHLPITYTFK
jgi:cytochrome P450